MPVYKDDKRGTWYVSYSYKVEETGKFHKKTKRGFKTCREAKQWERENHVSVVTGSELTFRQAADEYEKYMQTSDGTLRKHNEHFLYRFSEFMDMPISKISVEELVVWRNKLCDTCYSTKTKNTTIGLVKAVFKYYADVHGTKNAAVMLKKIKQSDDEVLEEMQVWTPEEFNVFLKYVEDEELKVFFSFLFWTGCRRGEAVALQIEDCKDHTAFIHYSQTHQVNGLKPTKTRQKRRIKIDDQLWHQLQPLLHKKTGYVFGGEKGLAISPIVRAFERTIKLAGVPHIRMHDLRHSHATWLINNGVNIVAVSKRLGHATIEQTLKTYTHLLESTDQDMMAKINAYRGTNHDTKK